MQGLFSVLLNAFIVILVFMAFLFIGIIKKQKGYVYASLIVLLSGGIWIIWDLFSWSRKTISSALSPRNGIEIYESLLGRPDTNCIIVLNYRDQFLPKIDTEINLHFKTCPEELQRILNRKNFICRKVTASDTAKLSLLPTGLPSSFQPGRSGDTLLLFSAIDHHGNGQEIYTSSDSTEVYLRDILD